MSLWNMLRRVRIRGLTEGLVQTASLVGFESDARDRAERFQDYGFAANPVDGEGLRLEVGGHTIILRMDRLAERPELAAHEVCVWHKEGHSITLKAGRLVAVDCDVLDIGASTGVLIRTPKLTIEGDQDVTGTVTADTVVGLENVKIGEDGIKNHDHGNVATGLQRTGKFPQ